MSALEYTAWAFVKGIIFAAIVTFFILFIRDWWQKKNAGNLYLNTLDALDETERQIMAYQSGVLPMDAPKMLSLLKERRFLNNIIREHHEGAQ